MLASVGLDKLIWIWDGQSFGGSHFTLLNPAEALLQTD